MTPLEKRLAKEHRQLVSQMNVFYAYNLSKIGKLMHIAKAGIVGIVASRLAQVHGDLNYQNVRAQRIDKDIEVAIDSIIHNDLTAPIKKVWADLHRHMQLYSILATAYIGRKATPPWIPVKVNLKKNYARDPKSDSVPYHLGNMGDGIMREINRGLLNGEPIGKIIARVKALFGPERVREGVYREAKKRDDVPYEESVQYGLDNPVELSEGIYSMDDVDEFRQELQDANGWDYREEKQWFSDAMRNRNRYLRAFEQDMASDILTAVSNGQIQVGSPEMGINDYVWVVSKPQPRCDECTGRDGKTMSWISENMDDDYSDQPPPLHPNCLIGDTVVSATGVSKQFKRWFSGKIITIRISGHKDLCITPNHPVLTQRGWVVAGELDESDSLVNSLSDESIVKLLNPNDYQVKSRIEDFSNSFGMSRFMAKTRMPVTTEYFHGDGIVDTNVDIIHINRSLRNNIKSRIFKLIKKMSFKFSMWFAKFLFGLRSFNEFGFTSFSTSNGIVSRFGIFESNLFRSVSHPNKSSLTPISGFQAKSFETRFNSGSRDADNPREIENRLSGHVSFVKIDSLSISDFSGHVYNLETDCGYYIANGFIVHNCRCQLVAKISDDWAQSKLEDNGMQWDQETGYTFNPTTEQESYGYQKMSWDDMLSTMGLSKGEN